MDVPDWLAWLSWAASLTGRVLTSDGVLALNIMFKRDDWGWFDTRLFKVPTVLEKCGYNMIDAYIWSKSNPVPCGDLDRHDIPGWEFVFLATKAPYVTDYPFYPVYKPYHPKSLNKLKPGNKTRGNSYTNGHSIANPEGARQANVLRLSSSGDQGRPRAKGGSFPRSLPERFIRQHTQPGDTVLDFCCGVGTTCKVAQALGRRYIGIEIDPGEADKARQWLADLPLLAMPEATQ
jgi:DNA modification methylase